ncbi:MAG: archaellin/type IV pilin N-terminal domain-containing protein [Nanoarchaeota archaeon]
MVMIDSRKGVSPVVATVLLLVLTIVIGGIVFSVVIPFVNDSLGESKECLDIFEGVEFPESQFNCYLSATSGNETGFSIKVNKEGISRVRVGLIDGDGNSDVFEIYEGASDANLRPMGGALAEALTFPAISGQRTYVVNKLYKKAEISALTTSGDVCSVADIIEFEPCIGVTFP